MQNHDAAFWGAGHKRTCLCESEGGNLKMNSHVVNRKSIMFKIGKKNFIWGILFINKPVLEIAELNIVACEKLDRKVE